MTFEEVVEVLPPAISLHSPSNDTIMEVGKKLSLSATATDTDGNIVGVSFYQNGNLLTTVNTAPYSYEWTASSSGTYTFYAEAFDTDGLSTKTDTVKVKVEPLSTDLEAEEGVVKRQVYPNPFYADGFVITQAGSFTYRILDMSGRVVEEGGCDDTKRIGLSLLQGIYLLCIESEQGRFFQNIIRQ